MSAYTHIIFDIDGTLIDTAQTGLQSLQKTVADLLGRQISLTDLYPFFGIPSYDAVRLLNFPDPEEASRIWEDNFQALMHLSAPFSGIDTLLEALSRSQIVLGLVTSRTRMEFDADPYLHRWLPYFQCSVCAEDTTRHKPHPDPLLYFIEKTHADKRTTLYVGDTPHDSQCAQKAGIDFALALWGTHESSTPATHRVASPMDLLYL